MQLREITAIQDSGDPTQIVQVRFTVADSHDPEARKEWIDVQVSVDVPTVRNGALLRSEALYKARDILDRLGRDFEHLGRKIG